MSREATWAFPHESVEAQSIGSFHQTDQTFLQRLILPETMDLLLQSWLNTYFWFVKNPQIIINHRALNQTFKKTPAIKNNIFDYLSLPKTCNNGRSPASLEIILSPRPLWRTAPDRSSAEHKKSQQPAIASSFPFLSQEEMFLVP